MFLLVGGGWSDWRSWSHCSTVCGRDTRVRTRSCTNPRPAVSGKPCVGIHKENMTCKLQAKCTGERYYLLNLLKKYLNVFYSNFQVDFSNFSCQNIVFQN